MKALFYPDVPFETLYIPYIYKEIYLDRVYENFLNGKKDLTIVDVGANIGCTVNYFRDFAKKIYAIEPSPEHFEALSQNKDYNHWDNVELFNYALSDKNGEAAFHQERVNRTMNRLNHIDDESFHVKTKTFATFIKENNIEQIDFCKFDVEGEEYSILLNSNFDEIANKIKAIEVEFHSTSIKPFSTIMQHMFNLGYKAELKKTDAVVYLFTR